MPPKKGGANDKVKKMVEDKTFGMKNKNKSSKMQKYMQQLQAQAANSGKQKEKKDTVSKEDLKAKKAAEEARKAELAELFKPVQQQQKVPFGVDPKTILCNFYKQGTCQKGSKCKFSHDVNIERKGSKIDVYTDKRDTGDEAKKNGVHLVMISCLSDTMDTWDTEKLESVISSKHSAGNQNKPTEIVCKFFLEALETRKYGWFWECPNGGDKCKYRHALPPGYVLKTRETDEERKRREAEEKENEITLEEFLETERHKLGSNLTPITLESFNAWKERQRAKRAEEEDAKQKTKADAYAKFKAGVKTGMAFSGKELFDFNPEMVTGGDDEGAMDVYERQEEEIEELPAEFRGVSAYEESAATEDTNKAKDAAPDVLAPDSSKSNAENANGDQVEVNEELFADEDLGDLEGLDINDDDDE